MLGFKIVAKLSDGVPNLCFPCFYITFCVQFCTQQLNVLILVSGLRGGTCGGISQSSSDQNIQSAGSSRSGGGGLDGDICLVPHFLQVWTGC